MRVKPRHSSTNESGQHCNVSSVWGDTWLSYFQYFKQEIARRDQWESDRVKHLTTPSCPDMSLAWDSYDSLYNSSQFSGLHRQAVTYYSRLSRLYVRADLLWLVHESINLIIEERRWEDWLSYLKYYKQEKARRMCGLGHWLVHSLGGKIFKLKFACS